MTKLDKNSEETQMTYNEIRKRQAETQMNANNIEARAQHADNNAEHAQAQAQAAQAQAQSIQDDNVQMAAKNKALEAYMNAMGARQQRAANFQNMRAGNPGRMEDIQRMTAIRQAQEAQAIADQEAGVSAQADLNGGYGGNGMDPAVEAQMQADLSREQAIAAGSPDPRSQPVQNPNALAAFIAARQGN